MGNHAPDASHADLEALHEAGILRKKPKAGPIRHESFWRSRLEEFSGKLEEQPEHVYYLAQRALAYRKLREYDQALADLDRAIELNPERKATFNDRGLTNTLREKFVEAIEDFTKAIEMDPDYSMALYNRGAAYLYRKAYPEAEQDFTHVIFVGERDQAALEAEEEGEEEDHAKKIADGRQSLSGVYKKRSIAFKKQKKFAESLADLEKAVSLNDGVVTDDVTRLRESIAKLQARE